MVASGSRKKQQEALKDLDLLFSSGSGVDYRVVIRLWRISMGLTRKEFSAFTGVPLRTIESAEMRGGNPTIKTIEEILARSPYRLRVIQVK